MSSGALSFPLATALRFLREGGTQTALILGGASVGVAVLVFLSCLIASLQDSLIEQTLGSQAHLIVRPLDTEVTPVLEAPVVRELERPAQRLRSIDQWPRVMEQIDSLPGVVATSPLVSGSAQASRGLATRAISLRGIIPERFDRIIPLARRTKEGDWRVQADGAAIGIELADDLGARIGDRIRILVDPEHTATFRVQAVFDLGVKEINQRWVLVPLRSAQTLLNLNGGISSIEGRVAEIFEAAQLADRIHRETGLKAESWMTLNAQLLAALRSQSSSSTMIQFFVIAAVALGISSVLVVSVIQKTKEIGILRAMGASPSQVNRIFLWQGGAVGISGALVGSAAGIGLLRLFALAPIPFTLRLEPGLVLRACAIAIATGLLAAVLPARRAGRMDPAAAIRS